MKERVWGSLSQKLTCETDATKKQPTTPEKVDTELEAKWEKQVTRFIDLGFHKEIGQERGKYKDNCPQLRQRPIEYIGRFDIPLLIDPRIPLTIQHRLGGIIDDVIDTNRIRNITPVPDVPYTIWTHNSNRYNHYHRRELSHVTGEDEIWSPQVEVTGLFLQYPEMFRDYDGVNAFGSRYGVSSPLLRIFKGQPMIDVEWDVWFGKNRWRPLTRGKQVGVGK